MCIIIVKPRNKTVSKKLLEHCWDGNNDGGGYAFAHENKIVTYKNTNNFEKYWKNYEKNIIKPKLEEEKNIIFHFRIRTSGDIDIKNTHPFRINPEFIFAHNGIISSIDVPISSKFSDTYIFNELLKTLPKESFKNNGIMTLIEYFIGLNGKLAFLDNKGAYIIIREKAGDWDEKTGCWFSNTSYKWWDYDKKSNVAIYDIDENRGWTYPWGLGDRESYEYEQRQIRATQQDYLKSNTENKKSNALRMQEVNNNLSFEENKLILVNKQAVNQLEADPVICSICGIPLYLELDRKTATCTHCREIAKIQSINGVKNVGNAITVN